MPSAPARYFPGRAPAAALFDSDDSDNGAEQTASHPVSTAQPSSSAAPAPRRRRRIAARVVTPVSEPVVQTKGIDSGFVPVKQLISVQHQNEYASSSRSSSSDSEYTSSSSSSASGDEDALNALGPGNIAVEEEQEEQKSRPIFFKPNLLSSHQKQEEDERRHLEIEEKREELRREEAQHLVRQALQEEDRRRDVPLDEDQLPNDEDRPEDHDADYAVWQVREILRIQRDLDELSAWEARGSSTAAAINENSKNTISEPITELGTEQDGTLDNVSGKPHSLQKSSKLGPFFMEKDSDGRYTEDIYNRDYNSGRGEEAAAHAKVPKRL